LMMPPASNQMMTCQRKFIRGMPAVLAGVMSFWSNAVSSWAASLEM
jgi:hypothetical protein